jgi:hypothetical protein
MLSPHVQIGGLSLKISWTTLPAGPSRRRAKALWRRRVERAPRGGPVPRVRDAGDGILLADGENRYCFRLIAVCVTWSNVVIALALAS